MNLDELKIQLNEEASNDARSTQHLSNILRRNPSSVVNGILKSLRMEIAFSVFFMLACIYVAFTNAYWSLRMYFGIFIFAGAAFTIILSYLFIRTKKADSSFLPVKQNLNTIVNIIETYCKYYFRFSIALMPICIFLALVLGFSDEGRSYGKFDMKSTIAFAIFILALCTGVYYFNKWWLHKLYGRYVQQLKTYLKELEESED